MPAIKAANPRLKVIASSGGVSAVHLGRKFGFERSTTDPATVLTDPEINTIFITTRHDTHARLVCEALRAGKHVFVEKPLALNQEELDQIRQTCSSHSSLVLMVGFNRRFAPHTIKMKGLLDAEEAILVTQATFKAVEALEALRTGQGASL